MNAEPYEPLISIIAAMLHEGARVVDEARAPGHSRHALEMAVNAGNTARFLPMVMLRDYPHLGDSQRLELYRILPQLFIRAHLGEGQDICWSKFLTPGHLQGWVNDSTEARVIQFCSQRTAIVTLATAESACVVSNATEATRSACTDFARTLSVAVQIANDIADFSTSRIATAQPGSKLVEGKVTYVVLSALERLRKVIAGGLKRYFAR